MSLLLYLPRSNVFLPLQSEFHCHKIGMSPSNICRFTLFKIISSSPLDLSLRFQCKKVKGYFKLFMSPTLVCMGHRQALYPTKQPLSLGHPRTMSNRQKKKKQYGSTRIKFGFYRLLLIWLPAGMCATQVGLRLPLGERKMNHILKWSGWNPKFSRQMYIIPDYYPGII